MVVSVAFGTMIALALARYRFRGRAPSTLFLFLPLATPDVVMGASLLGLFLTMNVATGFATIVIAHVMFNIAYVVVTVLARLQGMDEHIEEAAMDLGANEWTTFRLVTLPLIAPGVAAAAMLAFVLSIDDYIVTKLQRRHHVHVPAVHLRCCPAGGPAAGERPRNGSADGGRGADGHEYSGPAPGRTTRRPSGPDGLNAGAQ